ncbi:hypothetical protein M378DRAFT_154629 [Amanita muscaria Koide BX008]|uniref:C2 domain-containing protein n=1 Tax=Amanita muscaria (strain Koide BX008) TaxID=946122 RepID=A0A0C2TV11_AMAMK|nr:hypothetical protein M378DRAFT_154629 [Amanita muscaria Koide BX008]
MEEPLQNIWQLTAIRIQGLRLMRPDRSWRPIITVEVDKHHAYEFSMGTDGQNPNLKDIFRFNDANPSSVLDIKIWHKAQTKKKSKKRRLVATATHSLGELLKRQKIESTLEIRLQCECKHAKASKAKSQSGALFHIRLRSPRSISDSNDEDEIPISVVPDTNNDSGHVTPDDGYASSNSSTSSDTLNDPPSPICELVPVAQSGLRRRRRIRGYTVFSDDDPVSEYTSSSSDVELEVSETTTKVPSSSESIPIWLNNEDDENEEKDGHTNQVITVYKGKIHISDGEKWIAASLLPLHVQHMEEIKIPAYMNAAEEMLASFTGYKEMKEATGDSQFEKVFCRLQQEWTYVGGLLVALAALNTAAFSLGRGSIFKVDEWCQCAVAASAISTGLGIACDTWFLFRYTWADLDTFRRRAKDLFDSYFFFCLSARVPALCMVISGVSLMLFLGLVAYEAWPQAVLVISFFIGLMMTLQFLAFTAHWCAMKIVQGGKAGTRTIRTVVKSIRKI